jgi:hypothetical protein
MARRLIWHPESECLFEEHDDLRDFTSDQAMDVTGIKHYEDMFKDYQRQENQQKAVEKAKAYQAKNFEVSNLLLDRLLGNDTIHSCLNCARFAHNTNTCLKWEQTPPAKVIVYSCGSGWEPDIPF